MYEDIEKKCVYTAITGNYDFVREIGVKVPDFDYILFTDNKELVSNTWDVRYINNPDELDTVRLARQIKLQYWKYIPEYDFSVWVDGNVEVCGNIKDFLKTLPLDISDILVSKHPHRNTILQEANTCLQLKKESKDNLIKQINKYKGENMPIGKIPLAETGVLVRTHTKKIQKFCDFWFKQIIENTTRDQIAFPYTCWKNPLALFLFPAFRDNYKHVFRLSWKHGKEESRVW